MGFLRFALSLAVINFHTRQLIPFKMIVGFYAVLIFFVISGFYMALILNEKYLSKQHAYKLFITNRVLRLYPTYIIVFIASSFLYFACYRLISNTNNPQYILYYNPFAFLPAAILYLFHHIGALIYLLFSNVSMLGLDFIDFFKYFDIFSVPPLIIIPQAWTLSLEFYFYIMAPFLVRVKCIYLILIFFASVCLRQILQNNGLFGDPWEFRFFPSDLTFFLLGILSYKIYSRILFKVPKYVFILFLFLILGPILDSDILTWFMLGSKDNTVAFWLYFFIILVGLPIIFNYTKDIVLDRWIGEFSYPIYISHFTVAYFLNNILHLSSKNIFFGWFTALFSFIVSLFLLYGLIYPIEKIRANRVLSHKL